MRADALRRRRDIVAHAWRLFAERGGDVPLDEVAAASGVGIATLYRNFPAREALIHAVVEDIVDRIVAAVERAGATLDADPAAAWRGLVRELVEMDLGALTDALAHPERAASDALLAVQRRGVDALAGLLAALRGRGVVRDRLSAEELIVAIATITRPQAEPVRAAAPEVQRHLVEAFLAWGSA